MDIGTERYLEEQRTTRNKERRKAYLDWALVRGTIHICDYCESRLIYDYENFCTDVGLAWGTHNVEEIMGLVRGAGLDQQYHWCSWEKDETGESGESFVCATCAQELNLT